MLSPFNYFKIIKNKVLTKQEINEMITLDLNKGAAFTLDLEKEFPTLNSVQGTMVWHSTEKLDLDFFLVQLDAAGKIHAASDVVYFNNKFNSNKSVSVPFDSKDNDIPEDFIINLNEVPEQYKSIAVFSFLFKAVENKQTLGMITKGNFILKDSETGENVVSYNLADYVSDTSLHIGNFVRTDKGWTFEPEGVSSTMQVNDVINFYA